MNRKVLASAICAVLVSPMAAGMAHAQDAAPTSPPTDTTATDSAKTNADAAKAKPKDIDRIIVTGSLLRQSQTEQANPVTTITAAQIERQGFRNVYDALNSQPLSTGAVQDNQFSGGFTPAANTISLLGLSPDFTLILLDGRPMADYPLLYNGQQNFTDLASIPTGMVDHIDILPGNQSAIYGSSAIAGVVNIILKKRIDGSEFTLRAGGYTEGGGQNQRADFLSGMHTDKLDVVYGLQFSNQKPIWGYQRDFMDSTLDNPDPALRYGSRTSLHYVLDPANNFRPTYVDPGANGCDQLSNQFGGTVTYSSRPGRGFYCGSTAEPGYATILNKSRSVSAYLNASYDLGSAQLYGNLLVNVDRTSINGGNRFWETSIDSNGLFLNANNNLDYELFQHVFSPEETGGSDVNNEHDNSRSYNGAFGIRGAFGSSAWNYDAYLARSQFNIHNSQLWPLKQAMDKFFEDKFLGPKLGESFGYPIYAPNNAGFYTPVTPAQYMSFQGEINSRSVTSTNTGSLQITNDSLFKLPGGDAGAALLIQAGHQNWNNPTDPRVVNGEFWGLTGTQGSGARSNEAAALEFRLPLSDVFTADLATRFDRYRNIDAGSDSRQTYKLGLEWRPTEKLLVRGSFGTAFRAPDLAYVFAGQSGFFSSANDYYRCATQEPGVPIVDCTYAGSQFQGSRIGNRDLKSITAKSFGYGFVWSPTHNLNIKGDYYHVAISNEVSDLSVDQLLKTEAACRLGQIDPTSPSCVDALNRITRSPNGTLTAVRINPINVSRESVSGIVAAFDYRLPTDAWGQFDFGLDYNMTLNHSYQQYPSDPTIDLLNEPFYSSEFRTKLSANLGWEKGPFSANLFALRSGSTPNLAAQQVTPDGYEAPNAGKVPAYTTFNASARYQLNNDMALSLTANNVTDKHPPRDPTYTSYPYYNIFNYNAYGRAVWVEFDWKFGREK